jgi:hypothetical protein
MPELVEQMLAGAGTQTAALSFAGNASYPGFPETNFDSRI